MKRIALILLSTIGFLTYLFAFEYGFSNDEKEDQSRQKNAVLKLETKPTDKNSSVVMINYYKGLEDKAINVEVPTKIYDVGMTAYTKEFADKYGYPYEYVADLSQGMQAIGFEMKTMRASNFCLLNILLDEGLQIDFPEDEYVNHSYFSSIKFPEKRPELKDKQNGYAGYKTSEKYQKYMIARFKTKSYYNVNSSISTPEYEFRKQGGSYNGLGLVVHTKNTDFPQSRYLSLNLGCSSTMHKYFSQPELELWLKKKGGPDYTKVQPKSADNFIKFKIPSSIIKFAEKMIYDTNYNGPWDFNQKYYEKN